MPQHHLLAETDTDVAAPQEGEFCCGNTSGAWAARRLRAADIPHEVWDRFRELETQIASLQALLTKPAAPQRRR